MLVTFGDLVNDSFINSLQFEYMPFTQLPTVLWYFVNLHRICLLSCCKLEKQTSSSMIFEQGKGKEIKGREELQKGQVTHRL